MDPLECREAAPKIFTAETLVAERVSTVHCRSALEASCLPRQLRPPRLLPLDQLDVQAKALQLANEHVERLGNARREVRLSLHDGLVNLRPSLDVVGLRRQQLLKDVG